ncbi:MAG TPA: acyl carrier protein [Actinomycetota bacterium]
MKEPAIDRSDEIAERVTRFVTTQLVPEAPGALSPDTTLFGLVDSVGFMELLSFLEDEFTIEMDHVDIDEENLRTVRTIAQLVVRKTEG